jgi:hypothetical protein
MYILDIQSQRMADVTKANAQEEDSVRYRRITSGDAEKNIWAMHR